MKKGLSFFLFYFLICTNLFSQDCKKIDSLQYLLKTEKIDTSKVNLLFQIGAEYSYNYISDSALIFFYEALNIALKTKSKLHVGIAYRNLYLSYEEKSNFDSIKYYTNKALEAFSAIDSEIDIGICYISYGSTSLQQGEFNSAIQNFNSALQYFIKSHNKAKIGACYNNIGLAYENLGDYNKALYNYQKALTIYEEMDNPEKISIANLNIANIYYYLKNYEKAIEAQNKVIEFCKKTKNERIYATSLNNLGVIYSDLKNYNKALECNKLSLEKRIKIGEKDGISSNYLNIGEIYGKLEKFDTALVYFQKSVGISIELDDKDMISTNYNNIALMYFGLNKFSIAEEYAQKALEISTEIGSKITIATSYMVLSECCEKKGDFKKSLEYFRLFYNTDTSRINENSQKVLQEMEAKYNGEKKQIEIDKQKETIARKEAESKKQRVLLYSFLSGFIIILIFSIFLYRLFIQKKKANILLAQKNIEVEQKNEEITSQRDEIEAQRNEISKHRDLVVFQKEEIEASINYARRIQRAVLPPDEHLQMFLSNYFILFSPKDIVSGDFYWATLIKKWQIVTVADCTGHGVPGAFMSMLGVSFLNEIVRKQEVTKASDVLNNLRKSVIDSLKQTGKSGSQKDGMDMSLCAIDIETNMLQWAGANNPLWLVKFQRLQDTNLKTQENSSLNLEFETCFLELKGDKMPIAIYEKMDSFTNHELKLNSGDILYLMSDGYEDQFGGPKGKKFLSKNLKQLLLDNSQKPMNEQKEIFEKTLIEWIGEGEQIDDITLLGLKI